MSKNKIRVNWFATAFLVVAVSGCADMNAGLRQTNAALTSANQALSGASNVKVDGAFSSPPKALASDVASASPMVKDLVKESACLPTKTSGAAVRYLSRFYDGSGSGMSFYDPKQHMSYNQSRCLQVQRIGNWEHPAKNVLKFTVTYVSESSGESAMGRYTVHRVDNSNWYLLGF